LTSISNSDNIKLLKIKGDTAMIKLSKLAKCVRLESIFQWLACRSNHILFDN